MNTVVKIILLSAIFLFFEKGNFLQAQELYFKQYNTDSGLPSSTVYYVFQDKSGFLWFATDAGVSKYDGYSFTNYSTEDGLSDNEVFQIHQDSKDRIWFLTMNGQPSFYLNGKFNNPQNNELLEKATLNFTLLSYFEDDKGTIYLSSSSGGIVAITDTRILKKPSFPLSNLIWRIDDKLHFLTDEGLLSSNLDFDNILNYQRFKSQLLPRGNKYENEISFANQSILYKLKTNQSIDTVYSFAKEKAEIIFVGRQRDGKYWIGTTNGVYAQSSGSEKVAFKKYLDGYSVSSILEDREGSFWITTLNNGVFYSSSDLVYRKELSSDQKIEEAYSLATIGDTLWVGTNNNEYFSMSNGQVQAYRIKKNIKREIPNIRNFGPNGLWVSGKTGISRILNGSTCMFPYWANDVLIDNERNLWIASNNLVKFPENQWRKLLYCNEDNNYQMLGGNELEMFTNQIFDQRVNSLSQDKWGKVWIGTDRGLLFYENDEIKSVSNFTFEKSGRIESLNYSRENDLLTVCTQKTGLVIFKDGILDQIIAKKEGLSSNICYSVLQETDTVFWAATFKGLNKIIVDNGKLLVQDYSHALGLNNLKINDIDIISDRIYLATNNGLIYFDRRISFKSDVKPLISINSIFTSTNQNIINENGIVLSHHLNDIEFNFSGIYLRDEGNLTYHFLLEGADEVWQTTKSKNIQYKALSPGEYRFKVKVTNSVGRESDIRYSPTFIIQRPFWQTNWFLSIVLITALLIIYLLWSLRMKIIKTRFKIEKEKLQLEKNLAEIEQRALRLQMNPHFIFNALNTIKGYYAENETRKANNYIVKFSRLLRLILENNEQFITLETEIKMLTLYLELTSIRYLSKFTYKIEVDKKINEYEIGIPAMLLQPFIENAIIHGLAPKNKNGKLFIKFTVVDGNSLLCIVEDNGVGRLQSVKHNENKPHVSKGIGITNERLALISQNEQHRCLLNIIDLKDENENALGTRIEIILPLEKK